MGKGQWCCTPSGRVGWNSALTLTRSQREGQSDDELAGDDVGHVGAEGTGGPFGGLAAAPVLRVRRPGPGPVLQVLVGFTLAPGPVEAARGGGHGPHAGLVLILPLPGLQRHAAGGPRRLPGKGGAAVTPGLRKGSQHPAGGPPPRRVPCPVPSDQPRPRTLPGTRREPGTDGRKLRKWRGQ